MSTFLFGFTVATALFVTLLFGVTLGMLELKKQGKCPYCGQEREKRE